MFIISEMPTIAKPTKVKSFKDKIRMECVLQTADVFNRNRRKYSKTVINEGVEKVKPRINEGSLLGELDHPIDSNPVRQITVLYKEASHKFVDMGWDGNKLVSVVETLRTPNGSILKNLAEDGVPVGFSFRGMGDLREILREGKTHYEVKGPLQTVTWDAVSYPSHPGANMVRITEGVSQANKKSGIIKVTNEISNTLMESCGLILYDENIDDLNNVTEQDGFIEYKGRLFESNTYDYLVNSYVNSIRGKF